MLHKHLYLREDFLAEFALNRRTFGQLTQRSVWNQKQSKKLQPHDFLTYFDSKFLCFEEIIIGSYVFGKTWILGVNVDTSEISKIDTLSVLEIFRFKTL